MRRLTLCITVAILALIHTAHPSQAKTNDEPRDPALRTNPEPSTALPDLSSSADPSQSLMRPPGRLVVSVLWFENRAGSAAEHWRHGLEESMGKALGQVKAIRLRSGVGYARRKLGIEEGAGLDADQARRIGEIVEAQRVIWGSYEQRNGRWQVSLFLLNVASVEVSGPFTAVSTDWFDIRDQLAPQILKELSIDPSAEENQKMLRRDTSSVQAYELYVMAYAFQDEGRPLSEQEACLRRAIAADSAYAQAHTALGAVLGSQGELDQAVECARRALEIRQDHAQARGLLGICLVMQKKRKQALEELEEALRIEPHDALTLSRLAQLYAVQGKWDQAIVYDEKALSIEPMGADVHAHLGLAYVHKRNRDKAMRELKEAERLVDPHGPDYANTEQMISQAYHRLGEIPLAVEHFEAFIAHAHKKGLNPKMVSAFEEMTKHLKATLTPTFVEAQMPNAYTEQTLQGALQERLTQAELKLIVNPVAGSPEIRHWAQELTEDTDSELDRAKAIFSALNQRIQPRGGFDKRTAQEVFAAWKDPHEVFSCQEFAKLYLALAREVGIKAFYVHLRRDYRGKLVYHDCAIVFVEGKGLLVDPSYGWFGVPHKDFTVLDDVQTVAHHLFQHGDEERSVSRCRVAAKLHPDFAWGQLSLAGALWGADQRKEALAALENAERLEPGRWDAYRFRGRIAVQDKDWDTAMSHLGKTLELNPEDAWSHFVLGITLESQDKKEEAREAFRACLRHALKDTMADGARRAIVQINEQIGAESGPVYETAMMILAIEQGKTETVRRMLAEGVDANTKEASGLSALTTAALHDHLDIVRLLLENNADVNMKDNGAGGTALMAAAHQGHAEMVAFLLENRAAVNLQSKRQDLTALMMATQNGHAQVVSLLLQAGADVNTREKIHGVSALFMAAQEGRTEIVDLLLKGKADPNVKSKDEEWTALWMAAQHGHSAIVRLLLENNAEVNAKSADDVTALMTASAHGRTETARLLIEKGADVTAVAGGRTALSLARAKGHAEVVELLVPTLQAQFDNWVSQGMPIPHHEVLAYYDEVKTKKAQGDVPSFEAYKPMLEKVLQERKRRALERAIRGQ